MAKERIDALAEVLRGLKATRARVTIDDEVATLSLIVEQMAVTIALHEVQIQKLRETVAAIAVAKSE